MNRVPLTGKQYYRAFTAIQGQTIDIAPVTKSRELLLQAVDVVLAVYGVKKFQAIGICELCAAEKQEYMIITDH